MIATMMLISLETGISQDKFLRYLPNVIKIVNSNIALFRWISSYHMIRQWLDESHQIKHWFAHKLLQKCDGTGAGVKNVAVFDSPQSLYYNNRNKYNKCICIRNSVFIFSFLDKRCVKPYPWMAHTAPLDLYACIYWMKISSNGSVPTVD